MRIIGPRKPDCASSLKENSSHCEIYRGYPSLANQHRRNGPSSRYENAKWYQLSCCLESGVIIDGLEALRKLNSANGENASSEEDIPAVLLTRLQAFAISVALTGSFP